VLAFFGERRVDECYNQGKQLPYVGCSTNVKENDSKLSNKALSLSDKLKVLAVIKRELSVFRS
jgi:hypothetical protein